MRPRPCRQCPWLVSLALVAAAGCEEPRHDRRPTSSVAAPAPTPEPAPAPVEPAPPPPERAHGEILGRRTQDIRPSTPEATQGTVVAGSRITARDPITLQGNAYVVAIGQIATGHIKHAMDLYQAENGRYPANYDEFMTQIIKANNIALPVLPAYQEYFYDEREHKLQVREYPDRKAGAHPGER
jgi:hypothetical protein